MTVWLYQMSGESYSPEEYREAFWEGEIVRWPTGNVRKISDCEIFLGDTIIFAFVKTGTQEPGIYGWGIVVNHDKGKASVSFRPTTPSDYLKMNPLWDDDISNLLDVIRGTVKVGTMWEIKNDIALKIKKRIHDWIK
jgi:hypothetical protein